MQVCQGYVTKDVTKMDQHQIALLV